MPVHLHRDELIAAFSALDGDAETQIVEPVDAGARIGVVAASHSCVVWRVDGHEDGDYVIQFIGYTTVPGVVVAAVD